MWRECGQRLRVGKTSPYSPPPPAAPAPSSPALSPSGAGSPPVQPLGAGRPTWWFQECPRTRAPHAMRPGARHFPGSFTGRRLFAPSLYQPSPHEPQLLLPGGSRSFPLAHFLLHGRGHLLEEESPLEGPGPGMFLASSGAHETAPPGWIPGGLERGSIEPRRTCRSHSGTSSSWWSGGIRRSRTSPSSSKPNPRTAAGRSGGSSLSSRRAAIRSRRRRRRSRSSRRFRCCAKRPGAPRAHLGQHQPHSPQIRQPSRVASSRTFEPWEGWKERVVPQTPHVTAPHCTPSYARVRTRPASITGRGPGEEGAARRCSLRRTTWSLECPRGR